ncbi:uncharacterized protein (TIGR03084 family) [Modestobacter roseus]|uniref:Uncharacterized protein (TIGR03084 family) n=1 Tax=Modestobacter roseus TaxID=1181884 RepID=A0A562IPI9_9ACTN|nr:uncharacterized protein (TIGR03084 family) [Modestobacter roseus]
MHREDGAVRSELLADLAAEGAALDELVSALPAVDWARPTPAAGWTIAHQVAHLAWTDELARSAVADPAAFAVRAAGETVDSVDVAAARGAADPPAALLDRWRAGRAGLAAALATVPEGARVPWIGSSMSVASMTTARLMETWAHGVDVRDALGTPIVETARLDHVAHLGVRARASAFAVHGLAPPDTPVRVDLTRADGTHWTAGPEDAGQRVSGPLQDFCLRVVQRRPRAALALVAVGPDAVRWLDVAQAFAGAPGRGSEAHGHGRGRTGTLRG